MRVGLEFNAPNDCAGVDSFKQQVARRSERILFVEQPPVDGTAKVTLSNADGGVLVRMAWVRQHSGATGREFKALSCSEAIEAAALVIAITFDPSAPGSDSLVGSSEADAQGPPDNGQNQTELRTDDSQAAPQEPEQEQEADTQALEIPATDAGALTGQRRTASALALAVGATASIEGIQGVAPAPMEGFGLGVAVGFGQPLLAPQIRLAWLHFLEITYPADGGDAVFELDAARLSACPISIGTLRYDIRPCAVGIGGRLTASGQNTENPQRHVRPLWLVGAALLGSLRPVSVLLITGEVGLSLPIAKDRFQFQPDEFHQVSTTVLTGGLGIGIEVP